MKNIKIVSFILSVCLAIVVAGCSRDEVLLPDTDLPAGEPVEAVEDGSPPVETAMPESPPVENDIPDEIDISDEADEYGNRISRWSETSRFPLYAMIKSDNIYLYGMNNEVGHNGMVLFQDDKGTYFDWVDLAQYNRFPKIYYFDYDGDGERDLVVILVVGVGTGCLMTDLHVLKPEKDRFVNAYDVYSLLSDDIETWFTKKFTAEYSNDRKTIIVSFDQKDIVVENIYDDLIYGPLKSAGYGEVIEFKYNEQEEISVSIAIGLEFEKTIIKQTYIAEVEAKVSFDGKGFVLSDYKFTV